MNKDLVLEMAPTGTLRVALNMINFLLISGKNPEGVPVGVAPDLARTIADRIGVPLQLIQYGSPGELADDADKDIWDIGLIGAEPVRAQKIDFSTAYVEIEATYLVPAGSTLKHASEVDRLGNRIAVSARSAYDLWLTRNIKQAQLLHAEGFEATFALFVEQKLEAMAALKPGLLGDVARLPGSRILEGNFTTVQQSIGVPKGRLAAATYLQAFVDEIKKGLVAQLIAKHNVKGLSVAP
ncbi:MAG: transporter substrate-binding domain-containing protein [Betaproteobacteria bacterium]